MHALLPRTGLIYGRCGVGGIEGGFLTWEMVGGHPLDCLDAEDARTVQRTAIGDALRADNASMTTGFTSHPELNTEHQTPCNARGFLVGDTSVPDRTARSRALSPPAHRPLSSSQAAPHRYTILAPECWIH